MTFDEFKENGINDILSSINSHAKETIIGYIFGGAVMVYRKIKPSTKDIDIIFATEEQAKLFISAAEKAGFKRTVPIDLEYSPMQIHTLLEHFEKKWRLDIFVQKFAGKITLTKTIMKRSEPFTPFNHLSLFLVSNTDLFMLKSITERERDKEDMKSLLPMGIEWQIMEKEILGQKEYTDDILDEIKKFGEKYAVQIPFSAKTWGRIK